MSEEEIKILMAKEIVEEICESIPNHEKPKCRMILHRILVEGAKEETLKPLLELSEEARKTIKEKLKDMGVG